MMGSGLPTLIIGIGGTGLRVLQRVKERLLETYYGEVPPQIVLAEFDITLQSPSDHFAGVQLIQDVEMYRSFAIRELQLIQTTPTFTLYELFAEARQGNKRWDWVEVETFSRLLPPGQYPLINGYYRLHGRAALFMNYRAVAEWLHRAMQQVGQRPIHNEDTFSPQEIDSTPQSFNVFLVGSLTGSTGSGGFIDLAALLHTIRKTNKVFRDATLIGIATLPSFFEIHDDYKMQRPKSYAALRELDRLQQAHSEAAPYQFTGGDGRLAEVTNSLLDVCYLVDTVDRDGLINGVPAPNNAEHGALAAIADMIVAHTDLGLGTRLTMRYGAGNFLTARYQGHWREPPYEYVAQRPYSAFNSHTIIFPREDIARSLSLRFLIDFIDSHMIAHDQSGQLVVPEDPLPVSELVEFLGKSNPTYQERMAVQGDSEGKESYFNLGIFVQTMLQYTNRCFDTDPENVMRWLVEDPQTRKAALEVIRRSIEETTKDQADPTNMNSYVGKVRNWQQKYLGPLVDPNNIFGDREGGAWEKELGNLVTEQRQQMESYVQTMVLRMLNQRREATFGEEKTSLMRANRLSYVLAMLRMLKDRVRAFIKQADLSFGATAKNVDQLRRDLDNHRAKIVAFRGPIVPLFNPNPGPVYLRKLHEVAEAERQRLLRNLTVGMASQFGGDIADRGRSPSVLDTAIQEIKRWVKDLSKVRELIAQEHGRHEARRKEKYRIVTRSYVTDPARYPNAALIEDELYQRYQPIVLRTLLGPDPRGEGGAFLWEPQGTDGYFDYQITTKQKYFKLHPHRSEELFGLFGTAVRVEEIAREWQAGGLRLMAEQIRSDRLARVAYYLPRLYADQSTLVNSVISPNTNALFRHQGNLSHEQQRRCIHYLALNPTSDDVKVNDFYNWFSQMWNSLQHNQDFLHSESKVACSFLTLHHGLELDNFSDVTNSEASYRAIERQQGCLHIFPEERLAAAYEAQIARLKHTRWGNVRRLHPKIVAGLGSSQRVQSFALALVSGLIREEIAAQDQYNLLLCLEGAPACCLSHHELRQDQAALGPIVMVPAADRRAVQLVEAFRTYTLLGRDVTAKAGEAAIDYQAVDLALTAWIQLQISGTQASELIEQWADDPAGMIAPLLQAKDRDPRAFDLGTVLILELTRWHELFV